jgi:hypothetical protein
MARFEYGAWSAAEDWPPAAPVPAKIRADNSEVACKSIGGPAPYERTKTVVSPVWISTVVKPSMISTMLAPAVWRVQTSQSSNKNVCTSASSGAIKRRSAAQARPCSVAKASSIAARLSKCRVAIKKVFAAPAKRTRRRVLVGFVEVGQRTNSPAIHSLLDLIERFGYGQNSTRSPSCRRRPKSCG